VLFELQKEVRKSLWWCKSGGALPLLLKIWLNIAVNWGAPCSTTGWCRRKHISESLHPKMALQWAAGLLISGSHTALRATAIKTHNCVLLPFLGGGPSYLRHELTITQRKLLAGWYLWHCRGEGWGKKKRVEKKMSAYSAREKNRWDITGYKFNTE